MSRFAVRVSRSGSVGLRREAAAAARRFGALSDLPYDWGHDSHTPIVVFGRTGAFCLSDDRRLAFHPNMAKNRIRSIRAGGSDVLSHAFRLAKSMTFLDCTCGLGSDAITASYITGPDGRVVALEASPPLALLSQLGLSTYATECVWLAESMRRVTVVFDDYSSFLCHLPSAAFDVVYFDPMFDKTIANSSGIEIVRRLARYGAPSESDIAQAWRVARTCVGIKTMAGDGLIERLGFTECLRHGKIRYGVIRRA